jgi:gas vesicle protein
MQKKTQRNIQKGLKQYSPLFAALLIGGLIGAGTAILSAPRSGRETRELIRDKGSAVKDRALSAADGTRERAAKAVGSIASTTKDNAASLRERSMRLLERGKSRAEDEIHQMSRA